MATHSSVLAWRILGTKEHGGLLSMGSHRVGHDWGDLAAAAAVPSSTKVCQVKAIVFSSSHVRMWELDYKESWVPKNWCFWTLVLENTLESPLDFKEIQPVNPKGNQSWIFIGRTDAEAETPILWPPDAKKWLIWKDSDAGKDWRGEVRGGKGWDCWMAWLTEWTWVWVYCRSWWWRRPSMLQSMRSQRVGHDWATELNWTESHHGEAHAHDFIQI